MRGDKEGNYLTFELGTEVYGIELVRVREIIALMEITPLPLAPDYVRGVINLRNHVMPVVDLRRRFGMAATEDHDRKCIIVCDVERAGKSARVSILVDSVSEVLHIAAADIDDAPVFASSAATNLVRGIAKAGGGVEILLDVDKVLEELS